MKLNHTRAADGIVWLREGLRTYAKQPFALSGLFMMLMAIVSVVSLIPYIGTVLSLMLLPALTAGFVEGAFIAKTGIFPMPHTLFMGFREANKRRELLILGVVYAVIFLLLVVLVAVFDGGALTKIFLTGESVSRETLLQANMQTALLIFALFQVLIQSLFWFAPTLVFRHGVPAQKSLFASVLACWHHKAALLTYALAWFGLMALVFVIMAVAASALAASLLAFALPLAVVLLSSAFFTSIAATYLGAFEQSAG